MSIELEEQYDKIYRYCYYRLRNAWKAEDITQETFLRYLESDGYIDAGRPLAFLYTVAKNQRHMGRSVPERKRPPFLCPAETWMVLC